MRAFAGSALLGLFVASALALGGKKEEIEILPPAAPMVPTKVATNSPDPELKRLIEDLGSDDYRAREKAGAELAKKGDKALPHMRAALLATDDPEVQRRLAVLVRKMDRERLVEPKRVTYSAKDKTAKEIFAEIAKQTGYKIEFNDGSEAKYSFEFNNTPFWQAADAVANAVGFTIYAEYDDDSIRVYNNDTTNPHVAYAGPFRFVATNIQTSRNVQLSGIPRRGGQARNTEYMTLSFQIQSEPKNPMLGVTQPVLTEAKDDLGGSLLPPKNGDGGYRSGYYNSGSRGHNSYMSVNLTRGDRAATTIKSLKGRVGIVLLSGSATDLVVNDPLKAKKHTATGRSVEMELESVEEDANQKGTYLVSFTAKKLAPGDPERGEDYSWSQNLWQRVELLDDKGNKYFCYGPNTHENNGGTVKMVLVFGTEDRRRGGPAQAKFGPPKKLQLIQWLTITHEVDFAFKDIPLP